MADLSKLIDLSDLRTFGRGTIVPMKRTIAALSLGVNALADAEVYSKAGANGLRYYNDKLQYSTEQYDAVTPVGTEDPSEEGWYELILGGYVRTEDTAVVSGKTYYRLVYIWHNIETGGGTTIVQPPTVSVGTYTYSGVAQGPTITGLDTTKVEVTGNATATNAGTYTVTFALKNSNNMVWADLTNTPKTYTYTINKQELAVPTVADTSKTYNGSAQHPTVTGYDSTTMERSGYEYTNAGSYTLEFTLKDSNNYIWGSGDTTHSWSIAKAESLITLSDDSVTLDEDHLTRTVTLSVVGDGSLSVSSDDTSIATASLSGLTVTIASPDEESGTVDVTVTLSEGTNYLGDTATISVEADFVKIYGVEWDGTSDPAWSRTDGAADFTDPVPYYSGMSGTPGSPFDTISPWKDFKRVSDNDLGELVEIPKYYYKWTIDGAKMKLQISPKSFDGALVSPAHADRGDGKGERDFVYVGRYHCDSAYKSTTGVKPKANITRATARSAIKNLKTGAYQYDDAMWWTINMAYLVEFAHWHSQEKVGYGRGDGSATGNMGYTDNMPYHTGTTQSSRTTYGLGTQYRYIEGLWDNVCDWCDGIYFGGTSKKDVYIINNPNNFSDSSNGTKIGTRPTTDGEIKSWTIPNVSGFEWALYPKEVTSNSNYDTYVCDHCSYHSSGVVLCVGGSYYQSQGGGLFCLGGNSSASVSNAGIGTRLQYLP